MFVLIFIIVAFVIILQFNKKKKKSTINIQLSDNWTDLLQNVQFYKTLSLEHQQEFQKRVKEFILTTKVTGIDTQVTENDRVLIGASAIIPIFNFHNWNYHNLNEVLLYSDAFDIDFRTKGKGRYALGAVAEAGPLKNKLALSKKALHHGFDNKTDKLNTAIHEFVHLINGADGKIDGMPKALISEPNAIPWINLMYHKINEIRDNSSNIRDYGGANYVEFFAVTSEYFLNVQTY